MILIEEQGRMSMEIYQFVAPVLALAFCGVLMLQAKYVSWQFDRDHGDERAVRNNFVQWLLHPTKRDLLDENVRLRSDLAKAKEECERLRAIVRTRNSSAD
ncbi:hypothetical protein [Thioclava sp. DLFJ5-1]|uniref:hypothetical protein n=1 Tax=Thioclava sp. DLFJ5-1 TaxID=1915314 RepID=UPI001439B7AA|nr:hypothetical protein [Thioclava sp. DLFJ5-1]